MCLITWKQTSWCVANIPSPCLICRSPNITLETTYDCCFPRISLIPSGECCSSTSVQPQLVARPFQFNLPFCLLLQFSAVHFSHHKRMKSNNFFYYCIEVIHYSEQIIGTITFLIFICIHILHKKELCFWHLYCRQWFSTTVAAASLHKVLC